MNATTIRMQFTSGRTALSVEAASYAAACQRAYAEMRRVFGRVLFLQEFVGDGPDARVWIVADGRPAQGWTALHLIGKETSQ